MEAYPKATAVLVRNHGIYVWGDNWIQAKTQAECYHYLFDAAIKMRQMGLDPEHPLHRPVRMHGSPHSLTEATPAGSTTVVVLDIEGTTTPISFVTDVLFPYAKNNVKNFLLSTYSSPETQNDIQLLREQIVADLSAGVHGAQVVPPADAEPTVVVQALVNNVNAMIEADRKVTALKELQGHIWSKGYAKGELKGSVFEDVPQALRKWQQQGIKTYIYSSGSREAQRLIFQHSSAGDLRAYICGYFDTTTGPKRQQESYRQIALSVGAEEASSVIFCTDVIEEASAAKIAGMQAVILSRPGNKPLPPSHGFRVVTSLLDVL